MPELNFNALAQQGPQGVFQGYMQGQQMRNQMAAQSSSASLGDIQLQNALREQRLAGEEEAAYRAAGSDMSKLQSELMQRGLGRQALSVNAQMAKQRADQMKMHKDTVELTKTAAQQVMANPQNAPQILSSFGQRFGIDMSDDLAQIQQFGGNPDAIRQWAAGIAVEADKLLPQFETRDLGGTAERQGYNRLTGAPMGAVQVMQKTPTPVAPAIPLPPEVEAQKIRIARASQQPPQPRPEQPPVAVVDPATGNTVYVTREEALSQRMTPAGQGVALPPKEIQKREAAFPQAQMAIKGFESKSESFKNDLVRLRDHPGLSEITGFAAGRLPGITAAGRAAQALYDKVVAKGGFQALQDMRDASKTGGALGNVSNQEGKQLTASFEAIDRKQDVGDVKAAIDNAINSLEGSKVRMREAFDETYGYRNQRESAAPSAAPAKAGPSVSNW